MEFNDTVFKRPHYFHTQRARPCTSIQDQPDTHGAVESHPTTGESSHQRPLIPLCHNNGPRRVSKGILAKSRSVRSRVKSERITRLGWELFTPGPNAALVCTRWRSRIANRDEALRKYFLPFQKCITMSQKQTEKKAKSERDAVNDTSPGL
ncbi:hypothetical protein RRG08_022019 [Elysia crispata]|uniref:Uncharacterized protein n=1 Tax=Elysia crispata TaxID=231223 RepID=A0AAE1D6Y7_9GAST|nr:hypothetical protein RRG08_022019 [Elysia crispata]